MLGAARRPTRRPEVKARAIENLRLFLPTKWKALAERRRAGDGHRRVARRPEGRKIAGLQLRGRRARTARSAVATIARLTPTTPPRSASEAFARSARCSASRTHVKYCSTCWTKSRRPGRRPAVVAALGEFVAGTGRELRRSRNALERFSRLVAGREGTADGLKPAAVDALAGTRAGTDWLLELHEKKASCRTTLVADAGRLLRNSPFAGPAQQGDAAVPRRRASSTRRSCRRSPSSPSAPATPTAASRCWTPA